MRGLLYILVFLVVAVCSCTGAHPGRGFDEEENLILTNPSVALERLNAYDVSLFEDSADLARWALLYSEAMVAGNLSAPTDTIINIAVDYYGRHGRTDQYIRAADVKALITAGDSRDKLATALYLQKEKEYFLYKERTARWRLAGFAVFVLLIACAVIMWQRQRLRIRRLEYENLIAEASGLREAVHTGRAECSVLEDRLFESLSDRFSVIDELCQTYYESQGTKNEKKALADKVKAQIESIKNDDGMFAGMERSVNDCRNSLLKTLREEWPDVRPDDYRLLVYLASGLSNRTIALLLGESIDVVYKRKSRLKARISASDMAHREFFLSVF